MNYGFVKTATATPKIRVADPVFNGAEIERMMREASANGAQITVFPELCLSGYTCSDLFLQEPLISGSKEELVRLVRVSEEVPGLFFVGLPMEHRGKLYNAAAVFSDGELLGIVPKSCIPNYGEFYEARHFTPGKKGYEYIDFEGVMVPFGTNLLFTCENQKELVAACEICEDLWTAAPPSISHALHGATVIANLSASDALTGKSRYQKDLVKGQSARLLCAYLYASAGDGESTTDLVFSGHDLIAENGIVLAESEMFSTGILYADVDVERLVGERRRITTFVTTDPVDDNYLEIDFRLPEQQLLLTRLIDPSPFVPDSKADRESRCEEILSIQAMGLKKRLEHTNCDHAVIGISGGLDSTLALLVTALAFDFLGKPRSCITAVTMPCFGTTDRTYQNACELTRRLGAELKEVDIKDAVRTHFRDIGHDESRRDVTYENSQARERTQVLMDIANSLGGMVIGTGDMSELALGWATYNGDHMSMYGVNASVPKTLVRHLVRYYADVCKDEKLSAVLLDVLDTPVSPELLPPEENGSIAQKTEDIVGPYELHDFFLYYVLRFGFSPAKIFMLAQTAFAGTYDKETIYGWLRTFYRRFFSQQFKRSCLPDGPKVGTVAVSPRGDLRMPSDASAAIWMKELDLLMP
ncbi:MAG: NAD(+) synthase [Lachnospiraceae bacterium]